MSLGSTRLRANIDLDQSKRNFQLALLVNPFWPLEKIILLCELYSFSGKNGCHTFYSLQTNDLVTRKAYVSSSFYLTAGYFLYFDRLAGPLIGRKTAKSTAFTL